uniref:K Homology domain-containing protein n=1 Tax=Glycine max TaxID=3847 RepID=K7MDM6_SOYBN
MGKKQNDIQKTGLGRALLSRFYRKKFLESFNEVSDIDAVVEQSLEPLPKLVAAASTTLISLEPGSVPDETTTPEEARKQQKQEEIEHYLVGVLIGKAGDTIRYLQYNSGAKIQITRDADADPLCATRSVELIGILESIDKAEKLMNVVIAEADAGVLLHL